MRRSIIERAVVSFAFLAAACAGGPDQRAFVETLGSDTTAVEVFTRTATGFEGDLLVRAPVTRVAHYTAELDAEGLVSSFELEWRTPAENPEGPGPEHISISFEGDSVSIERQAGDNATSTRVEAAAGAVPLVGKSPWSYAILDQLSRQSMGSASMDVHTIDGRRGRAGGNAITRQGDSVSYSYFGRPMMIAVDAGGGVTGLSGGRTTNQVMGTMVEGVDITALAADFAARDARGEGLGVASPPGSVDVTVAGASIQIDYSRPAKRGREIWGGLVPLDTIWRTGANSATMFTTNRDLEMGGTRIPAGSYTLWTTFSSSGGTLVVNSQTGQWGTDYDMEQDFARIPMEAEELPEVVERFTIEVEEADGGGRLTMAWDRTRYAVPFRVGGE